MTGARFCRRGLKLLAVLLAAFALLSAVWYVTAYRPYDVYVEALRAQPGFREDPGFPACGVDAGGCTCNVARPGFLSLDGEPGHRPAKPGAGERGGDRLHGLASHLAPAVRRAGGGRDPLRVRLPGGRRLPAPAISCTSRRRGNTSPMAIRRRTRPTRRCWRPAGRTWRPCWPGPGRSGGSRDGPLLIPTRQKAARRKLRRAACRFSRPLSCSHSHRTGR